MSALKNQLRLILPGLSKEANSNQDKEIRRHLYLIKAVCASEKSIQTTCQHRGVSTDQFYLWAKRLLKFKTLACLSPKSRKPASSPRQTKKRIERKIRALRIAEPSHGAERISFDLKRLFKITCAPMTVYNVLKRLKLISSDHRKKQYLIIFKSLLLSDCSHPDSKFTLNAHYGEFSHGNGLMMKRKNSSQSLKTTGNPSLWAATFQGVTVNCKGYGVGPCEDGLIPVNLPPGLSWQVCINP